MTIGSQKLFTNCRIRPRVRLVTTVPACVALPGSEEVQVSLSPVRPRSRAAGVRSRRGARWATAALVTAVAASLAAVAPSASAIPAGDEPGLTMRAFQLGQSISELCTLKAGQTPNVDQLKQTIDWKTPADFGGLEDNFVVEALANLSIEEAATYEFRLISDD